MTREAAIARMREVAEGAIDRFRAIGLSARVELDYLGALLQSVEPKRAKFITLTLVITAPDTKEGSEYCLSLGADVHGGREIDDGQLEKDISSYLDIIEESLRRLASYEDVSVGLNELANEASREYDELVKKLDIDQKKQRIISSIGIALAVIGVILLFVVATLEGAR